MVKHLCDRGVTPDAIIDVIPWRKQRLFRVADGHLTPEEFTTALQAKQQAEGLPFEARRWFCAEDQLIYCDGQTYAFSNQWGNRTLEAIDLLIATFPAARITYRVSDSE